MEKEIKYPIEGLGYVIPEHSGNKEEIHEVYFKAPKKHKYDIKWFVGWQPESGIGVSMMEQAESSEMKLSDYKVRDCLMCLIGIGNSVIVNQSEVAKRLHMEKATVNRSIKKLLKMKILLAGPKSGRSCTYMFNPAFIYSGSIHNGIKERIDRIKETKHKTVLKLVK